MRPRGRRARGFSLVELLVALTVSAIVIAGAIALMLGTQRHFQATAAERHLQETARVALGHLATNLRLAGFGVDPAVAFDLGQMAGVRIDRAPGRATFSTRSFTGPGTVGSCTGLCRDSTAAPDELVFLSRDPSFGPHPLTAVPDAASTDLTVAGNAAVREGQVLLVACYTGEMTWTYVQAAAPSTYSSATGTTTIPIAGGTTTFPNQNAWLGAGCYRDVASMAGLEVDDTSLETAAKVFKVDRYRYFVASYDASGRVAAWGTAGARPYLMLDQGLRDGAEAIITPVVPDVEDLQLAYVFPRDAATPVVGATAGTAIASGAAGIDLAPAAGSPIFADPVDGPSRRTHHPGNVGAVRVHLVVRSASADLARRNASTVPAAGNRPATAGPAGYHRLHVETTVSVPNLSVRAPYYPTYRGARGPAAAGKRQLNVGGG